MDSKLVSLLIIFAFIIGCVTDGKGAIEKDVSTLEEMEREGSESSFEEVPDLEVDEALTSEPELDTSDLDQMLSDIDSAESDLGLTSELPDINTSDFE
ncbi:MAG: hypothetical protein ACPL0A_02035 [Candidatus Micrarchaeia archaeon]